MTAPKVPPYGCAGCDSRWGGLGRAHGSCCHRTYSGITAFDAHRKGGVCNLPGDVGLVRRDDGIWGYPADEDATPWWEGRS